MQATMSILYPEDNRIAVLHDDEKAIDEFDVPIVIKLSKTMRIALSLKHAEELASKLESCIQDYRISVLKEDDMDANGAPNPFEVKKCVI